MLTTCNSLVFSVLTRQMAFPTSSRQWYYDRIHLGQVSQSSLRLPVCSVLCWAIQVWRVELEVSWPMIPVRDANQLLRLNWKCGALLESESTVTPHDNLKPASAAVYTKNRASSCCFALGCCSPLLLCGSMRRSSLPTLGRAFCPPAP